MYWKKKLIETRNITSAAKWTEKRDYSGGSPEKSGTIVD